MGKCRYEHNDEEVKLIEKLPVDESAKTKAKKNAKKDGGNGNELKLASKKHGSGSSSVHNPLPHMM